MLIFKCIFSKASNVEINMIYKDKEWRVLNLVKLFWLVPSWARKTGNILQSSSTVKNSVKTAISILLISGIYLHSTEKANKRVTHIILSSFKK